MKREVVRGVLDHPVIEDRGRVAFAFVQLVCIRDFFSRAVFTAW